MHQTAPANEIRKLAHAILARLDELPASMGDAPSVVTFTRLIDHYRGQLKGGTVRQWLLDRENNGLAECLSPQSGKALLFDLEKFDRWLRTGSA